MNAEQIAKKIAALSADELVESNDGTHGLDPQWHTWHTYERLDGTRYTTGRNTGAGRTRHHTYESAASRRLQIAALQQQLKTATTETQQRADQIERLERGWDGYQFVGVEKGRELASRLK